jgi:hypothetical protein
LNPTYFREKQKKMNAYITFLHVEASTGFGYGTALTEDGLMGIMDRATSY